MSFISDCFSICGARNDDADTPRWMRGQDAVSTAFTSEKMHYSASDSDDLDSPDETVDYVVSAIFDGSDNDAIRASVKRVEDQFSGANTAALRAWKTKVATGIFERVFRSLNTGDSDADPAKPGFLDGVNKQLADMCHWVVEHGPEIFAWSADYVKEHDKEISVALACACAVAVVWVLVPWALEALGFEAGGVRLGSVAADLMRRYMGYIPKGSWMSFFQRLGARWGRV